MSDALLAKYDTRIPRYTSYPTAPHFHPGVGATAYGGWLGQLAPDVPLSLYLHIPFCDSLCWFCGCHTRITRRYAPIGSYLEILLQEVDLVASRLGGRRPVCHVHLGGGTPTILRPADLEYLFARLRVAFDVLPDADIAIECDPRGLDPQVPACLAAAGVNRASLGLQDIHPEVQKAVNRVQSLAETCAVAEALREAGIDSINVDLMYGLPHQTEARVLASVDAVLRHLEPQRIALFGYAHVPWMKKHQGLIDTAALPDASARFAQFMAAAERLQAAGYDWIGLDHFALPDDSLAVAARAGRLHRNFQGYTTDDAPVRLGFGPSAIGMLSQGFVQNAVPMHAYRNAVADGCLPVVRGLAIDDEDRLRSAVIERLMCDLTVDLGAQCRAFGRPAGHFDAALAALGEMEADGLVVRDGARVTVTPRGRPFLRNACAAFDAYLVPGEARHARAI